jgi:O-antigen/teichoic acid export membrane protein
MLKSISRTSLARNTAWMITGQGLRLIIQAVYFIEIARSLGVSNYGAFVGVVALVGVVYPFASLGSGNLLVKNVARDTRLFAAYWGRALTLTSCFGTILFLAVCLVSHFLLPPAIPRLLVVMVAAADIFGLSVITLCAQAFQAYERLHWTAALNVMMSGGRLAGALILIALQPHPSALLWSFLYLGCTAVVAIVSCIFVCQQLGPPKFSWPLSSAEMREGFYFSASQTSQTVYNDVDKTMLVRLSTLEATGIYGAAYRIIDVSFVPVSALLWSSYPNFFRAGSRGISCSLTYAKPLLLRALLYSGAVCVVLLLAAGIVPYVLGPEYRSTAEALRWLSVLPVLKAMHYFLSDTLTGAGHQGVRTSLQASVAVLNVLLNLWILPAYSWRGAAWSSIASDGALALSVAVAVWLLNRRSPATAVNSAPNAAGISLPDALQLSGVISAGKE